MGWERGLEMPAVGALALPLPLPGDGFWNPGPLPISPVLAAPQALTKHPAIWFPLAGLGVGGSLLPGFSGTASLEEGGIPAPTHLGRRGWSLGALSSLALTVLAALSLYGGPGGHLGVHMGSELYACHLFCLASGALPP